MRVSTLADAVTGAVLAEVGWRRPDGTIGAAARVPLLDGATPMLALTFDDRGLADELAAATEATLTVSDSRWSLRGWRPISASGRVGVEHDLDGAVFEERLLDEELRKHPPSRLHADSLLQRREYWWFLPRLLVSFVNLESGPDPAVRTSPDEGVLVWAGTDGLCADSVRVDTWQQEQVHVTSLAGRSLPDTPTPACLLRHDAADDLERRVELRLEGELAGGRLRVARREGHADLPALPSWWGRLRQAKRFERECRRAIAEAERGG